MIEKLRFVLCALLLAGGLFVELTALLGVNRFRFSLNRIHAASLGDTLGLFLIACALGVYSGFSAVTVKLCLMVVFLWLSSPVSGHLLGELVYLTDERMPGEASEWKS